MSHRRTPHLLEIDKQILNSLKRRSVKSPALIGVEIGRDRRYVANRLRYLTDIGFVEKVIRGLYRLRIAGDK
ncbi:MAG: transcriptional regulator [Candidatus Bathyarchaeota archaeon]|nr:transcriptional regulator [Candidatus Bathyarchaeota archaeon]